MKIYNLNNPIVNEIFLNEQQSRNISYGDVDPFWFDTLGEEVAKGITIPELKNRIKEYYNIMEIFK